VTREAATDFVLRARRANLRSRVDAATAEVVRELRADGVRPLLLKGPAIASLLYEADSRRTYWDTDLLVGPSEYAAAERCLSRIGFRETLADSDIAGSVVAGHTWRRAGGDPAVDLHWTFAGVGATPSEVWDSLSESTRVLRVAGVDVEAPGVAACALIVALHAAHHGLAVAHPLEDLARALDLLDRETWAAAARLAERLGATDAFTSGVTLHPTGRRLAADISLPTRLSRELVLRRGSPPPGAVTLEVLASTEGALAKLRLMARKVVPSRRFMRTWFPRATRSRRWLAAGYLWRPVWLLLRAWPAISARRRAGRTW
jgi:putative nucleotidyltransferase-like protein